MSRSLHLAKDARLQLYHTALPEALKRIEIRNLRIRDAVIDIAFERYAETVGVNVLRAFGKRRDTLVEIARRDSWMPGNPVVISQFRKVLFSATWGYFRPTFEWPEQKFCRWLW